MILIILDAFSRVTCIKNMVIFDFSFESNKEASRPNFNKSRPILCYF